MFRRKDNEPITASTNAAPLGNGYISSYTRPSPAQGVVEKQVVIAESENTEEEVKEYARPISRAQFETVRQYNEKNQHQEKPRVQEPVKKNDDLRFTPAASVRPAERTHDSNNKSSKRVMTVGQDTFLKGEISTCDKVIVEGQVDAKMTDVQSLEITETGSFKGSVTVVDAEISGMFEGDLNVKGRLLIFSTGKVIGTIRYGEVEIQRGGKLAGEIRSSDDVDIPLRSKKTFGKTALPDMEKSDYAGAVSELFAAN